MEIFNCAAAIRESVCGWVGPSCRGRRMPRGGTHRKRRSDADQKITEIMNGIKRTERLNGSPTTVKRSRMFPTCKIFAHKMLFIYARLLIISIFFNFNFPVSSVRRALHSDFPTWVLSRDFSSDKGTETIWMRECSCVEAIPAQRTCCMLAREQLLWIGTQVNKILHDLWWMLSKYPKFKWVSRVHCFARLSRWRKDRERSIFAEIESEKGYRWWGEANTVRCEWNAEKSSSRKLSIWNFTEWFTRSNGSVNDGGKSEQRRGKGSMGWIGAFCIDKNACTADPIILFPPHSYSIFARHADCKWARVSLICLHFQTKSRGKKVNFIQIIIETE